MVKRVAAIRRVGEWDGIAADRVLLDAGDRQRRRIVLTAENGTACLLDLERPVALRDGDGLVLDDGTIVRVVGLAEPLVELAARTPRELVRLAWHLGNRHTDVQLVADGIRIRRDHVLEDMAARLGATVAAIEAPFDPESSGHGHDG